MPKIKVNEDLCIGCGTCESICPEVFRIVDGKSQVVGDNCQEENCQEAVDSCPTSAISLG